jgi:hypothetical protein
LGPFWVRSPREDHGGTSLSTYRRPRAASRTSAAADPKRPAAAGLNGEGVEPVGLHDPGTPSSRSRSTSGVTLAEAAVLARHANAKVTGAIYAGVSEQAKAKIADRLTAAGFGS